MLSDVLKLGDKIDVTHLDKFGRHVSNARTYVSQLIDFADKDIIHIATPIVSSTPIVLNVGESYELCFYTTKGLYKCNCVILKNQREKNIIIAVVRITTNLERYQRRQFYRLECILDIQYHVITHKEELLDSRIMTSELYSESEIEEYKEQLKILKDIWLTGTVKDISGGGMRFTSSAVHEKNETILINLTLAIGAAIKNIQIRAFIISTERVVSRTGLYEYRIEFSQIANRDREDLIKYIFEQERKRR